MTWLDAALALAGVIVGTGGTLFIQWLDRRERYHVLIFQKRLEVHQVAYAWRTPLFDAIESKDADRILKITGKALKWWDENCLYLDDKSQRYFWLLLIRTKRYANSLKEKSSKAKRKVLIREVWDMYNKAFEAIHKGVGAKYLPELYK